jgi:YD repeat-containing protein
MPALRSRWRLSSSRAAAGAVFAALFLARVAQAQGFDDSYNAAELAQEAHYDGALTDHQRSVVHENNMKATTAIDEYARSLHDEMAHELSGAMKRGIFAFAAWASHVWNHQYNVLGNAKVIHSCSVPDGATYSVPFGSYQGAMLGAEETYYGDPIKFTQDFSSYMNRSIRYGQSGNSRPQWDFEPQGMLTQHTTVTFAEPVYDYYGNLATFNCSAVTRYAYSSARGSYSFQSAGVEKSCDYSFAASPGSNMYQQCTDHAACAPPAKAWSTNGQVFLDASDASHPVLYYPKGDVEVLSSGNGRSVWFNAGLYDTPPGYTSRVDGVWFTANAIDRNGNTTAFRWLPASNQTRVVDPRGRTTTYQRNTAGLVTSITKEGPGGVPQIWSMTYQSFNWNPAALFPDFLWTGPTGINNTIPAPTSLATPALLTQLTLPDGQSYHFYYTQPDGVTPNWGALSKVIEPDGAVQTFAYGGQGTPFINNFISDWSSCPSYSNALAQRRMVSSTVYPLGTSGPAYTSTIAHVPATAAPWVNQIVTTRPDGSVLKHSLAAAISGSPNWRSFETGGSNNASLAIVNQPLADEVFASSSATTPIQATYFGDMSTGTLWVAWETGSAGTAAECAVQYPCEIPGWSFLDIRPQKIKHVQDGVTWWEQFTYDPTSSGVAADSGYRTFGNVTNHSTTADCSGSPCATPLVQRVMSYLYGSYASYAAAPYQNLIRLPLSVQLEDGSGKVLKQTTYKYDEYALAASGQARLDTAYTNSLRGNATTANDFFNIAAGQAVTSHSYYFDNGVTQKTQNPVDVAAGRYTTTTTSDFRWVPYTSPPISVTFGGGGGTGAAATCSESRHPNT